MDRCVIAKEYWLLYKYIVKVKVEERVFVSSKSNALNYSSSKQIKAV